MDFPQEIGTQHDRHTSYKLIFNIYLVQIFILLSYMSPRVMLHSVCFHQTTIKVSAFKQLLKFCACREIVGLIIGRFPIIYNIKCQYWLTKNIASTKDGFVPPALCP